MRKWTVDAAHSEVGFTVKHMMISKVKGSFADYSAVIEAEEDDIQNAKINFTIEVASINTNNTDRDNHLRSSEFFDVETFPQMTFVSKEIKKTGEDSYSITGDLTIKGITKPITFQAEYGGKGKNPWGVEVVAFEAKGKLKRSDFGLTWNQTLETGGVLVGDDITLLLEIEANPA